MDQVKKVFSISGRRVNDPRIIILLGSKFYHDLKTDQTVANRTETDQIMMIDKATGVYGAVDRLVYGGRQYFVINDPENGTPVYYGESLDGKGTWNLCRS